MKIRINTDLSQEPHTYDIPLNEVNAYIDLLNSHYLIDENGDILKVDSVLFDIHQNAIDVNCAKKQ